jgi:kexin
VKDNKVNDHQGTFIDWHLKLWGESIDAAKATLLPMPSEDDDADHDKIITSTQTAPASTATAPPSPEETHSHPVPDPSEHPDRPVKPATKPKPTTTESGKETAAPDSTSVAQETTETASSSWISWLPTLGASKAAQPWIYGALGLIVAFCIGLGIYFWIARRRRLRNDSRSNYEFEMLHEEEGEGLNAGEKVADGSGVRGARRTRGGELYDAFAGGSDDEDEFDRYSDRDPSADRHRESEQYIVGEDDSSDDDGNAPERPLR